MRSKVLVPVLLVIVLATGGWFYYTQQVAANSGQFVLSGTIEATEINLPTRIGGIVKQV